MLVGYEYNSYKLGVALGVHWTPGPTAPPHWLVVGPSGTGKTVFSGQLAARMVLRENARLWVANYKDDNFFQFLQGGQEVGGQAVLGRQDSLTQPWHNAG